jgi:hypothetical protein
MQGLHTLFPGMDPQPTGPQSKNMRAQKQVLDRRGTVLEQVTELLVVRCLQVTANDDPQCSGPNHLPVRQSVCDP